MAKRAVLICNWSMQTKNLYSNIRKGDFIIAVDGGANKLVKTKFIPSLVAGDMDSISRAAAKKYKASEQLIFPREKALVDLEIALNYCIEKKFDEILILGAIGSRVDMTLTNVFLLSQIPPGIDARIVHEDQEVRLFRKGSHEIEGNPGEIVSLFPIEGAISGLSLSGFRYNLDNYNLPFGIGIGVSNEFKNKKARITFKDGLLLCVHIHRWF